MRKRKLRIRWPGQEVHGHSSFLLAQEALANPIASWAFFPVEWMELSTEVGEGRMELLVQKVDFRTGRIGTPHYN